MWPAIPSRSRVEVTPCPPSELRAGQIAAFERGGQVVVHRVRAVSDEGVFFAGDSRAHDDGCVAFGQVLGHARVIARRRLRLRLPGRWHVVALWRSLWRLLG